MNTEKTAFEIISLAGDAKAEVQKALAMANAGKYNQVQDILDSAQSKLMKAHELQTQELLAREANGEKLDFNVLISHAQDYLMTAYTFKDMAAEIINLHKLIGR